MRNLNNDNKNQTNDESLSLRSSAYNTDSVEDNNLSFPNSKTRDPTLSELIHLKEEQTKLEKYIEKKTIKKQLAICLGIFTLLAIVAVGITIVIVSLSNNEDEINDRDPPSTTPAPS